MHTPPHPHIYTLCHTVRPRDNAIQPVSVRAGYLRCYYTPITSTLMCNQGEVMACALATHTLFPLSDSAVDRSPRHGAPGS